MDTRLRGYDEAGMDSMEDDAWSRLEVYTHTNNDTTPEAGTDLS